MPSFNDLELQDLELKPPYMDATLLLDTLSTEDIDWQSYNLFSDENLNSSLKDQIKEENIDIDVLSSICPNDLLNSMDEMEHQYKGVNHLQQQDSSNYHHHHHHHHGHLNHLHYQHNNGHDHSHHQLHHLAHHQPHPHAIGTPGYHHFASSSSSSSSPVDSLSYQTSVLDEANNGANGEHMNCQFNHLGPNSESSLQSMGLGLAGVYSEQDTCFSTTSSPLSSSSSSSPSAVSTSPHGIDFGLSASGHLHQPYGFHTTSLAHKAMSANTLNQKIAGLYQIQNIKTCPPSTIQHQLIKNIHTTNSSCAQSPIMMVPNSVVAGQQSASLSPSSSQSSNSILLVETGAKLSVSAPSVSSANGSNTKLNKSNILPLSPPSSSVGSDSESNHSSSASSSDAASTNNDAITPPASKKLATGKNSIKSKALSKNSLKNSSNKHSRHHPYPIKSSSSVANSSHKQVSPAVIKRSSSPVPASVSSSKISSSTSQSDEDCWPFLCSLSKLPSSGTLMLTEEEKRTLVQEGHQVPSQLPLSKGEEKILKKIRRKIKNKISAQESRRKKKEYVDSLEKRMENYINENVELKKRLEDLELNNKSLLSQLQKMQINLSNQDGSSSCSPSSTALSSNPIGSFFSTNNTNPTGQFGTLFMVLVLFFAVVLGVWSPVLTKDQITNSAATAATAAAATHSSARSSTSSTAAVVVATATAAATAATVATIKTEAVSPAPVSQSQSAPPTPTVENAQSAEQQMDTNESTLSQDPFSSKGPARVLTPSLNEEEPMSYETSSTFSSSSALASAASSNGPFNPVNSSTEPKTVSITSAASAAAATARSKTGTAVELTKVRPFVKKLPCSLTKPGDNCNQTIPAALVNATNMAAASQSSVEMSVGANSNEESTSSFTASSLLSSSSLMSSSSSLSSSSSSPSSQVIILNLAGNNNSNTSQGLTSSSANALANTNAHADNVTADIGINMSNGVSNFNNNIISTTTISTSNPNSFITKPMLTSSLPLTLLGSTKSVITLNSGGVTCSNPISNGSNFRVINTNQVSGSSVSSLSDLASNASGNSTTSGTKMTTRFRLINNPAGSVVVAHPSVIKLNTSA